MFRKIKKVFTRVFGKKKMKKIEQNKMTKAKKQESFRIIKQLEDQANYQV